MDQQVEDLVNLHLNQHACTCTIHSMRTCIKQYMLETYLTYTDLFSLMLKVAHCDICRRQKKLDIAKPELHPIPVKCPWYHLGIGFVGLSPPSDEGNHYILTVTDYFTKFTYAQAGRRKSCSSLNEGHFLHIWDPCCHQH